MNNIKICCGFGHRQVFDNISNKLENALLSAIEQGCNVFYTGDSGEFDKMFSSAVRRLKKVHPGIKLICIKPYMTKGIFNEGNYIYTLYDDVIIPDELAFIHYKSAITKRNMWMIDRCDIIIGYLIRNFGGAYQAIQYAEKSNKSIVMI